MNSGENSSETRRKWLKMSKVVIALIIQTKGQFEVKNVKLNKVCNTNKALPSIKNSN